MQTSWIRGAVAFMLLGPEADAAHAATEPPMSLQTFVNRLEVERAASTDSLRSWRSGETLPLDAIGILGEAIAPRRNLGEALRIFAKGFPILQSNSAITLEVNGDEAHVAYRVLDPRIWPRRADAELTLGLIRGLCDRYGVPREAIRDMLASEGVVRAFGHRLYPAGDPRAKAILASFDVPPLYTALAAAGEELLGEPANIDFSFAALSAAFDLPEDAPFVIFALARTVGWLAHAMEQVESGDLIRPRAHYAQS